MSVTATTILEFFELLFVYSFATVILPALVFRRLLRGLGIAAGFCACLLIGNLYVMTIVCILTALNICNTLTLLLLMLVPSFLVGIRINKVDLGGIFRRRTRILSGFMLKEVGFRTFVLLVFQPVISGIRNGVKKMLAVMRRHPVEWILFFLGIGFLAVFFGYRICTEYGYMFSDTVTHMYWINSLEEGLLYVDGIYPYGLHWIVFFLYKLSGIAIFEIMRIFGVIETLFVYLTLLAFMKCCCKNRYAPYVGFLAIIMTNVVDPTFYNRFYSALPQEFGMMFVVPCGLFLALYVRERTREGQEAAPGGVFKKFFSRKSNLCLVFFAISLALTIETHFYNTVVAGFLCIAVLIAYAGALFRKKYIWRIIVAGLIGTAVAAAPMLIYYWGGAGLQGSFTWGTNIINLEFSLSGGLSQVFGTIVSSLESFFGVAGISQLFVILLAIPIILIPLFVLRKIRADLRNQMMCLLFVLILTISFVSSYVGLPYLMDASRSGCYLAWGIAIAFAAIADLFYSLLRWMLEDSAWVRIIYGCVCAGLLLLFVLTSDFKQITAQESTMETNGAIISLYSIVNSFPNSAWTIVSAGDESRMIGSHGWHYETIRFLNDIENVDTSTTVTITTKYIFFFIEKRPLLYYDYGLGYERQFISEEGAQEALPEIVGTYQYSGEQRWILMSRMYYWAEAFAKLYPVEFGVYYEDDEFVCYYIEQNVYDLYNLVIDYGYNSNLE